MSKVNFFLLITVLLPSIAWAEVQVVVSVTPLKYFVERVGGEHVKVEVMVQSGHSPVTYEPTPRQMAALSQADVYVRIGVPFEASWISKLDEINPNMAVIDGRNGIELLPMHHGTLNLAGADAIIDGHNHATADPHVWLDPSLVKSIARNIRDQLIQTDSSNSTAYQQYTEQFLQELDDLDDDIRRLMAGVNNSKFLVFHPAWGYFARAYGLTQISVEYEGKEPGPNTLARLIKTVRQLNIGTVFAQKQFSTQMVATLAAEIDGKVVVLDPLAEDYMDNLRAAAKAIAGA